MKLTIRHLLAFVMALCVAMSMLTACTGSGEGQTTTTPTQQQTDTPTDPTNAPTDPTEAPTDPTQATTEPTQAPTDPTEAPTDPPVTDPPVTEPPATEPPATEPPATEPPATDPPVPDNDIGKEIANEGFAITVVNVEQSEDQYIVTFTLSYTGEGDHPINARERIFVVNSDRRSLAADSVYDADGNSLLGSSIQPGQTLTIKAVFILSDGFTPSAFRYVYDTMGFRRLQAEL